VSEPRLSGAERVPFDRLLSRVLLREPDAELEELLCASGLMSRLDEEGALDLEAYAEEYTRLFLLPEGAPPFASAWLEGERERLGAQFVSFVNETLAALGRETDHAAPWGNLPRDHLGLLLDLSANAFASDDAEDHALGEHFCQEAIQPWVGSFARALRDQSRLPLYRLAAELLLQLHALPTDPEDRS
jgi:TorA maturation chaperone TorD